MQWYFSYVCNSEQSTFEDPFISSASIVIKVSQPMVKVSWNVLRLSFSTLSVPGRFERVSLNVYITTLLQNYNKNVAVWSLLQQIVVD